MVAFWHFRADYIHVLPQTSYPPPPLWFLSLFDEGHSGVGLFLVLSGFIFHYICDGKDIIYWRFIANRALRIAPLAIVWILFYFFSNAAAGSSMELLASSVFLLNRGAVPGIGWSVVVEFQCYVVLPFLLVFFREIGLKYMLGLLLVFFALRLIVYLTTGTVQLFAYSYIFGRIDQFIIGILGAELFLRRRELLERFSWPIAAAGFLLASVIVHDFDARGGFVPASGYPSKSILWTYELTLEAVGYAVFIVGYLASGRGRTSAWSKTLASLGGISYSLYWCHTAVFKSLNSVPEIRDLVTDVPSLLAMFIGSLMIALTVSGLTYFTIEQPFFALRKPYFRAETPVPV